MSGLHGTIDGVNLPPSFRPQHTIHIQDWENGLLRTRSRPKLRRSEGAHVPGSSQTLDGQMYWLSFNVVLEATENEESRGWDRTRLCAQGASRFPKAWPNRGTFSRGMHSRQRPVRASRTSTGWMDPSPVPRRKYCFIRGLLDSPLLAYTPPFANTNATSRLAGVCTPPTVARPLQSSDSIALIPLITTLSPGHAKQTSLRHKT
ncbi:hypothetical protein K488DRAFT_75324 [Vararia minispora EC-137]|uniref:Uncharacterized protein n=2 Tax=Vararia minispora EC-137 TaxID=1314806 RepID=A0ACB8Q4B6_9AGAM|nr:hypothetical protein K488DRAFT_75327 [Vararia minispora EC-137]KAI0026463.1 hypothetical protein K488DRAFT_75324 [Vararia minispora EC-137]